MAQNRMLKQKKIKNSSAGLQVSRFFSYLLLIFLTVLCLFPFYILLVNSSRSHVQTIAGFSLFPGNQLLKYVKVFLNIKPFTIFSGM